MYLPTIFLQLTAEASEMQASIYIGDGYETSRNAGGSKANCQDGAGTEESTELQVFTYLL